MRDPQIGNDETSDAERARQQVTRVQLFWGKVMCILRSRDGLVSAPGALEAGTPAYMSSPDRLLAGPGSLLRYSVVQFYDLSGI